ncbi:hypothetical protein ABZ348_10305 [Streptomyces sp. NPDC005963]|uniref:hypothetical protein n=1 Tax=Streptomyces sp. NPDC005963 TaxID=3156721 RepID=UPI0033E8BBF3
MLARFCARGDLKALGVVLPAYLGDLGTADDRMRLSTALQMVHAARWLPVQEQAAIGRLMSVLAASASPVRSSQ